MNKLFLAIFAVLLSASLSFAQTKMVAPKAAGLVGKVKSMAVDASKNLNQIVVVDSSGKETAFAVSEKTQVFDKDSKPSTLTKLANGETVDIKYVTVPNGAHAALAIRING